MNEAFFTFIKEDRNVRAWLGNKFLANKLKHAGRDVQSKISSETVDVIAMDNDIFNYGSDLLLIHDDMTQVKKLRTEESRLRQEIATAQEQLEKAKSLRKNIITLAIAAVIAIIISIGILIVVNRFGAAEPELIENVEEQ